MLDRISFEALEEGSPLFRGYVKASDIVKPWYGGFWTDEAFVRDTAKQIQTRSYKRGELVEALKRQHQAHWAPPEALAQVEALGQPNSLVILTGQQAGLLGGPLYTWFKALTAIKVAKDWSKRLGCPVVPVFWIAADDHDAAEITHFEILDKDHSLREMTYHPGKETVGLPACRIPLNTQFGELWPALEEGFPPSEFRAGLLEAAKTCYAPGRTMVTAFAAWLTHWFGKLGLVVVDPSDPAIKRLAVDLFLTELEEHPKSRHVYDERTKALVATGVTPQIHLPPDVLNLMWMEHKRQPMRMRQGAIEMDHEPAPFNPQELKEQVRKSPEKVSPNVLLNPLYQDTVFPALAHIVGPSETAYFAQVLPLYARFGMTAPVLVPRWSATLMSQRAMSAMEDLGLEPLEVLRGEEQAFKQVKSHAVPEAVSQSVERARKVINSSLEELEREVKNYDAGLTAMVSRARSGFEASLSKLDEKLGTSAERQSEVLGRKMAYVRHLLRPHGMLQERVLNITTFMVRHGFDLTERLADQFPEDLADHYLVKL